MEFGWCNRNKKKRVSEWMRDKRIHRGPSALKMCVYFYYNLQRRRPKTYPMLPNRTLECEKWKKENNCIIKSIRNPQVGSFHPWAINREWILYIQSIQNLHIKFTHPVIQTYLPSSAGNNGTYLPFWLEDCVFTLFFGKK